MLYQILMMLYLHKIVFTHCTYEYTKECIEEMKAVLNTDKIIFNMYSKEQLISLSNVMTNLHNNDRLKNAQTCCNI